MYHEMHTRSNRSYYLKAPFDQVTLLTSGMPRSPTWADRPTGRLAHVRLHRANSNGVREGRGSSDLTTSNSRWSADRSAASRLERTAGAGRLDRFFDALIAIIDGYRIGS